MLKITVLGDEKKFEIGRDRDDTPDTVMSSSSPELGVCQTPSHFPGIYYCHLINLLTRFELTQFFL